MKQRINEMNQQNSFVFLHSLFFILLIYSLIYKYLKNNLKKKKKKKEKGNLTVINGCLESLMKRVAFGSPMSNLVDNQWYR